MVIILPPSYYVGIAVNIPLLYLLLLHKLYMWGFISKIVLPVKYLLYVHFSGSHYITYRFLNNTSQSYVYKTYVASIIQYPLQIPTYRYVHSPLKIPT
jgi:hypothetical protein